MNVVSGYEGLYSNDALISSVQKLQNFAVKVAVRGVKKYDHISPFFTEFQWLRMKQKLRLEVDTIVFKALRGFYPDWLLSFKSKQKQQHHQTDAQHVRAA